MSENSDIAKSKDENRQDPPELVMTESSIELLGKIEDLLEELVRETSLSPAEDEFYYKYLTLLQLYDDLQRIVLDASDINSVCTPGCSCCCCHWVEDVNSFEGMIIGRYIEENFPDKTDFIRTALLEDQKIFDSLRGIADYNTPAAECCRGDIEDYYDLLLSCFYQQRRPCALLNQNGRCIVYPVRPLTCRDYLNLRDPAACLPDRINHEKYATLIISISDTIIEPLEILHQRFDHGSNDKSLRTLLPRSLKRRAESSE